MKYNADLYKLIKSLTKSEKRYFKIYSAQHTKNESNNYILLFDAIDQQENYNEERLKRKFKNHIFGKNLAKTKYLLYELIIKMQLQLRNGKDVESRIKYLLHTVEFQYSKSLYDQAFVSLRKAKKLAIFFEHYGYQIEVLNWEKLLFEYSLKMKEGYSLNSIHNQYKKAKDLLSEELQLSALFQDVHLLTESANYSSMNNLIIELELLFKNRLITKNKAKTFRSKLYTNEVLALQAMAMKNFDSAFLQLEKNYDLWIAHIEKVAIFPHDFIRFCTIYMRCSANAKQKGDYYDELLQRLLEVDKFCSIDSHKLFFIASLNDFIFNLTKDNLEVCSVQIFTIKDCIDEHLHRLSFKDQIDLYYHISIFYFIKREYGEALNWIEKLQNLEFKKDFSGLQGYCELISLVSKYEERKHDELEFDLNKIRQLFNAKKEIRPIENLVLTYIERLINMDYSKDESVLLNQFFHSLQQINDGNLAYEMTANNALNHWVTNKITTKNIPLLK